MELPTLFNQIDNFVETYPHWAILIVFIIVSMSFIWHCVKHAVKVTECVCGEIYPEHYFTDGNQCPHCNFKLND